jgi:hypothetical protein
MERFEPNDLGWSKGTLHLKCERVHRTHRKVRAEETHIEDIAHKHIKNMNYLQCMREIEHIERIEEIYKTKHV